MMAEALGQAEVVRSANVGKTLREGRRLLLNIVPLGAGKSRVRATVLTKAFQLAWGPIISELNTITEHSP